MHLILIQYWFTYWLGAIRQQASTCNNVDQNYRQVSNISRTFVGNYIIDHSDVAGASPIGAAPTTSSFST